MYNLSCDVPLEVSLSVLVLLCVNAGVDVAGRAKRQNASSPELAQRRFSRATHAHSTDPVFVILCDICCRLRSPSNEC